MTDRVPCCIHGCRRTFKRDPRWSEFMCGKHYGADKALKEERKIALRKARKYKTAHKNVLDLHGAGYVKSGSILRVQAAYRLAVRWHEEAERLWLMIKANAQRLQDEGFFAPKWRTCRKPAQDQPNTSPLAGRFEDQFQRLKTAMKK